MAERTLEEATSSTPPNGHVLASKSTCSDETSVTYPAPKHDDFRVSEYKSINTGPQTQVSPDNQCSSTFPSSHPSALTGSTKQGDKTERQMSSDKSVSLPLSDCTAHKKHSLQVGSLSPNSHRKTNDIKLLRCELCNKFFSEADFDFKAIGAVPLTREKITVCPDCNKKILEGSRMAPPTQTKNLEASFPTAGNGSTHLNNVTAARSSQCCCMASHQLTTSQISANMSETVGPELLRTIKTEPPSEPYAAVCSTQANNPHTYHNHTYQTKCSIYLTANLKPCGKRDKESVTSKQDPSSCGDQQKKKPKLDDDNKGPGMEKRQSTNTETLIKRENSPSSECSADVKPSFVEVKPSSNGHAKIEVKQETSPTESSKSNFQFKSPTKPAPLSSSGATSHKPKINSTSNTYMFEGSMLWKPVHPGPAPSASSPKVDSTEEKPKSSSSTEKKEEDENTFCCEGSLFIKPVLPNEFAFEGTMFIKPDSPLLAQAPVSFPNQPSASGLSSMPQTTKTLTIQSVFTNSGQVISSITTTSSGDKSEHVGSNGNSQQTQLSTVVTTSCVGSGSKCTVTSCCTNQIATKDSELKKKPEQDKETSAGFSQCQTSGSGGGGGGHTDFSVKSILSATDRRSYCDSRRYQQH